MKWRKKVPAVPAFGTIRHRSVFAWLPELCLDGFTRWLTRIERIEIWTYPNPPLPSYPANKDYWLLCGHRDISELGRPFPPPEWAQPPQPATAEEIDRINRRRAKDGLPPLPPPSSHDPGTR